MMAMESGEIDLLYGTYQITYDMFDYLKEKDGIEAVVSDNTYATRNLLLNTSSNLLSDIKLRKAIQHGINKEQINNTVLHGMESAADTLFPVNLPYCDVEQAIYDYDPALVANLLEQADEKNALGIRGRTETPFRLM